MIEVISPPTLLLLYSHLEEREKELKVSNLTLSPHSSAFQTAAVR